MPPQQNDEVPDLVRVESLCVVYRGSPTSMRSRSSGITAVADVSFSVKHGEAMSLVGESGSGKSTTARVIAGLLDATSGRVVCDDLVVGRAAGRTALRAYRRRVQMVFQDPYASLNPRMTIGELVAEPARHLQGARGPALATIAARCLDRVGLPSAMRDRYPHEVSGGQRQRVSIARALSIDPKLLICDEAVSALDVSVQADIVALLRDLRGSQGLALLFITHDLALLPQIGGRVAVMRAGRIVELGAVEDIISRPGHPYTAELIASVPDVDGTETPTHA